MTPPDSGAAGQDPDMGTGRAAGLAGSPEPGAGAETSAEASALDQSDERHRCAAEENFKAAFGRYPQRVELPTRLPRQRPTGSSTSSSRGATTTSRISR